MWPFSFFSSPSQIRTKSSTKSTYVGGKKDTNSIVTELYQFQTESQTPAQVDSYCYSEGFTRCGLENLPLTCAPSDLLHDNWCDKTDSDSKHYYFNESLYTCEGFIPNSTNVRCLTDVLNCCTSSHSIAIVLVVISGFITLATACFSWHCKSSEQGHSQRRDIGRRIRQQEAEAEEFIPQITNLPHRGR